MMKAISKNLSFKFRIIFIITTLISSFFILPAEAQESVKLEDYLVYFYNRYSEHLDEWGLVYKAPDYGVANFRRAQTAREILSLATYYKYRALAGEGRAQRIIRAAILNAGYELNSRPVYNQSFSDAWAQMDILTLIDQLPNLLNWQEKDKIYSEIIDRIETGILINDTSNRAALSAVYWQQIINNLSAQGLIRSADKQKYDNLIYKKITSLIGQDVSLDGWYFEGNPMKFNPHYHLITAFAFMSYAEITGDIQIYLLAKKMTENLRSLTFTNGMVEARIGERPIGLGAQFYLGAGLLNYKFGYDDYSVYLNYAAGDRFFSDPKYPNRLEYHSTIKNSLADYHDDISFSNLAELALLTPSFGEVNINPSQNQLAGATNVVAYEDLEIQQVDYNHSTIQRLFNTSGPVVKVESSIIDIAETYDQPRLYSSEENQKAEEFYSQLKKYFSGYLPSTIQSLNTLASAYIYGGYTIEEIVDTIKNGPRAVHPSIPAIVWRRSPNYQEYLNQIQ